MGKLYMFDESEWHTRASLAELYVKVNGVFSKLKLT